MNQYTQVTTPQTTFVRGSAAGATTVTVKGQSVPLGTGGTFNARVTTPGPATIVATAADGSTSTETRTVALPPATFAPSYDADGNMLSDGLWTYTWDGENRLVALESTPTNPMPQRILKRFTYDYQSRRISEERHVFDPAAGTGGAGAYVLEKAIRWVNDGWNQSVELLNDRPIRAYVWGLDLSGTRDGAGGVGGLLSSVDLVGSEAWDYLYNGNGNVVGLADRSSGSAVGEYVYGPFGEESSVNGNAARVNLFRFSTKVIDPDAGLIYYGYRYYQPRLGRWISKDPIEEAGGINVSAFLSNSSIGHVDHLGNGPIQTVHPSLIQNLSQCRQICKNYANDPRSPKRLIKIRWFYKASANMTGGYSESAQCCCLAIGETCFPGPYNNTTIPATGPKVSGQNMLDLMHAMQRSGNNRCHHCNTPVVAPSGDHQPPTGLRTPFPQNLYVHCDKCRVKQGGEVRAANAAIRDFNTCIGQEYVP